MDPTVEFFAKLKKLSVTLESETAKLQHAFENRNNDVDCETTARAMRAYHELNCDVGDLKGQIQEHLTEQRARRNEVSSFIKACRVTEQGVAEDIQTIKGHWEKYGYEAPGDTQPSTSSRGQESHADDEASDESKTKSAEGDGGSQEEPGDNQPSTPPMAGPPPVADVLRTPQLSDYGLSEMQLKRALAGADWCSKVPPMPEINLPYASLNTPAPPPMPRMPKCILRMDEAELQEPQMHDFGLSEMQLKRALAGADWCSKVPPMPKINLPYASLNTPAPPPMPRTPKCILRMDEAELQEPQMHDFGISEHTMLNDFTMALPQKNTEKPTRPTQNMPVPPENSLMEIFQAKDNLESPDPPVFCTPGFKIKKTKSHCSPPVQGDGDPQSPVHPREAATTPEVPTFQTPYLKQLVSAKKSAPRQPEPISMRACVSKISILGVEDEQMPEMPNLESRLGISLQNKSAKMPKNISERDEVTEESTVNHQELDGATQEFCLGTPQLRKDFQEPSTPEMPDLSSVTQDICKLLSQAQRKKTAMAVVHPHVKAQKHKYSVSVVSESEFKSLPGYLRQMTLCNLNQAIHDINKFLAECQGDKTAFQMDELCRITNVGAKTPVYVLCLTELKRLSLVRGAKKDSVYELCTDK